MRCTERCPDCPTRKRPELEKSVVSGDYPNYNPHRIMFVGEAPGKEENNRRRVFIGKTGEEFNSTYLPLAGLSRGEIWMTNSVKCHWADSSDAPPLELVKSCSEFHLRRELEHHKPQYVVLMGGTANSLLDWDVEMEHGMVHKDVPLLGWRGTVFSTYHPALGLHKSDAMLAMVDKLDGDFPRLRMLLQGRLQPLVDNLATKFERIRDPKMVRKIMQHGIKTRSIAVDTESRKLWRKVQTQDRASYVKHYDPWCATWSTEPGSAYMVRIQDEDAFREFLELLLEYWRVIFHNMAYDFGVLQAIARALHVRGIDKLWDNSHDTMQMAYDDGRLPKGLKALGYRLLGKRMISFDETVVPHSRDRAIDYLQDAIMREWPAREQDWTGEWVKKNCSDCKGTGGISNGLRGKMRKTYPCDCDGGKVTVKKMTRKHGVKEKLGLLASSLAKGTDVDLWKRWDDWLENDPLGMRTVISAIGPMPLPSIEYVPEDQAIEYACGDAHETLRIFPVIQQRLVDLRRRHNELRS